MTRKDWEGLSAALQWRKAALAAGWYDLHYNSWWALYGRHQEHSQDLKTRVPAYLEDLNAMHEVETAYINTGALSNTYAGWLQVLVEEADPDLCRYYHPTAAQRAEAFVLTMEKSDG